MSCNIYIYIRNKVVTNNPTGFKAWCQVRGSVGNDFRKYTRSDGCIIDPKLHGSLVV